MMTACVHQLLQNKQGHYPSSMANLARKRKLLDRTILSVYILSSRQLTYHNCVDLIPIKE